MQTNSGQTLLQELLAAFARGADATVALFADEATVEYPYAPSLGAPAHLDRDAYYRHLQAILPRMPALRFTNLRVYPLQESGAYWAEVHGEATIPGSTLPYQQDYVLHFTVQNGRFHTYREYWNPLLFTQSYGTAESGLATPASPAK